MQAACVNPAPGLLWRCHLNSTWVIGAGTALELFLFCEQTGKKSLPAVLLGTGHVAVVCRQTCNRSLLRREQPGLIQGQGFLRPKATLHDSWKIEGAASKPGVLKTSLHQSF